MTKQDAEAIIDRSLARLGLERRSLQFHWWNTTSPRYVEVATGCVSSRKRARSISLASRTSTMPQRAKFLPPASLDHHPGAVFGPSTTGLKKRSSKPPMKRHETLVLRHSSRGNSSATAGWDWWNPSRSKIGLTKYKLIITTLAARFLPELFRALHRRGSARCRYR